MTYNRSILLSLFSAILLVPVASIVTMNVAIASSNGDDADTLAGQQNLAQSTQGGGGQGQPVIKPQNGDDDNNEGFAPGEPDPTTGQPLVGQSNRATSEQTGGISAGDIIQRSNSAVTEQYCKTIAGIGDRRCQQEAPEGALQECSAIAGLGRANCVQSENPDGTGTCLSANGKPFICETSTGKSISGSGQAGQ